MSYTHIYVRWFIFNNINDRLEDIVGRKNEKKTLSAANAGRAASTVNFSQYEEKSDKWKVIYRVYLYGRSVSSPTPASPRSALSRISIAISRPDHANANLTRYRFSFDPSAVVNETNPIMCIRRAYITESACEYVDQKLRAPFAYIACVPDINERRYTELSR